MKNVSHRRMPARKIPRPQQFGDSGEGLGEGFLNQDVTAALQDSHRHRDVQMGGSAHYNHIEVIFN